MSQNDRRKWDRKWLERDGVEAPASWLVRHQHLLPGGVAADLACGRGANAVWLGERGYSVLAVDGSLVALRQAQIRVAQARVRGVLFVHADLDQWRLPANSVDLLTVFRFLDRALFPMFRDAVRPGGLIIYETRTLRWLEREPEASAAFLLRPRELRAHFGDWAVLEYEESAISAAIVARRPVSV